jgi:predicted Rossmann fold flavoprotein
MKYDVVIIGGGPAGMMAGGRAGECGARVVLVEKNERLGVKLLSTGGERCNVTNDSSVREMINRIGENGKFLFSAFNKFGPQDIIDFLEERGLKIKTENNNRVFPFSNNSKDVLDALVQYLEKSQVQIKTNSEVKKIVVDNKKIEKIVLTNNEEIIADNFILCTGGKSYPLTGSTGDGYLWLTTLGHTVTKLSPALTAVMVKEKIVADLEGLSLDEAEISLYKAGKKIDSQVGSIIFTKNGVSGPLVIDMSRKIGKEFPEKMKLQIDFKPKFDFKELDEELQKNFQENNNKMFKNSLDGFLPKKLTSVIIELSKIDPNKKVNLITRQERKTILHLLKEFDLTIKCLAGYNQAVVTSGGVKLSEVDPRTMKSKIIENLYFAGEILDVDGPTGGYNLQICWSTGCLAGNSVLK